jgi:hypothetical protein
VVSKNDIGDRKTPFRAVINRFRLAVKQANLEPEKRVSACMTDESWSKTDVKEKVSSQANIA